MLDLPLSTDSTKKPPFIANQDQTHSDASQGNRLPPCLHIQLVKESQAREEPTEDDLEENPVCFEEAYPEPIEIVPCVFLGNYQNATNSDLLKCLGIHYILNVAEECNQSTTINQGSGAQSNGFHYLSLNLDHGCLNFRTYFPTAFCFIHQAIENQSNILVHCQLGVSRSAAMVVAYVMQSKKIRFQEAYEWTKVKSPVICPNLTLVSQLIDYEHDLFDRPVPEIDCDYQK